MLNLNCKIIVYEVTERGKHTENEIVIDFVNQIEIESTWKEFTDTATITLPRFIESEVKGVENPDKNFWKHLQLWAKYHPHIEIYLGYHGRENLAFKGSIRDVQPGIPVTLICEDDMFHFKTKMITYSSKEADLKSIVESFGIIENVRGEKIKFDYAEGEKLGAFITEKPMTPVKILNQLKEKFGVYSFIRYDENHKSHLVIGKEYDINHGSKEGNIKTRFGGNFIFHNNIIENDLEYKYKEDINLKVTFVAKGVDESDEVAVSYKGEENKNLKLSESRTYLEQMTGDYDLEEGDKDLDEDIEELTFYIFQHDLKEKKENKEELKKLQDKLRLMAKRRLEITKYDGFRGSFTTFGDQLFEGFSSRDNTGGFVRHGDTINLEEQERVFKLGIIKGHQTYFVDGVTYSFGEGGFRQNIQLGKEKMIKE